MAEPSSFITGKDMIWQDQKDDELTYTHQVTLRFTNIQYDIICKASKDTRLSISEYIHRQLMKGKVIAKYEIVADVPELKKLVAEFGKIGSNLNQIARHFNQGESIYRKCVRR